MNGKCTYQEERLHLVFVFRLRVHHIQNRRISSVFDLAMLLYGLEDLPTIVAVALVSSQAESKEQRFNRLRSEDVTSVVGGR